MDDYSKNISANWGVVQALQYRYLHIFRQSTVKLSALPFQGVFLEEVFPSAKCFFCLKTRWSWSWSCKHINQYWPPHLSILRLPCTAALLCLLKTLCEVGLDTSSLRNFYPSFIFPGETYNIAFLNFPGVPLLLHLQRLASFRTVAIQRTVRDWLRSTSPWGSRHNPEQLWLLACGQPIHSRKVTNSTCLVCWTVVLSVLVSLKL